MSNQTSEYQSLYECWMTVGKASLKCQRVVNKLMAQIGISVAQHEIMLRLFQYEGITQKEVTEKLLVVKSNVTNHIRRLESLGFVYTARNDQDLRSRKLFLTEQGRKIVEQSSAIQKQVVTKMLQSIPQSDLDATNRVMNHAIAALGELE